jgi:hypothetical protein
MLRSNAHPKYKNNNLKLQRNYNFEPLNYKNYWYSGWWNSDKGWITKTGKINSLWIGFIGKI